MTILDELSSAIRSVHDSAGPAVVGIGQRNRGSGVVVADGRVLTNAHNLRGDEVTVTIRDGRTVRLCRSQHDTEPQGPRHHQG